MSYLEYIYSVVFAREIAECNSQVSDWRSRFYRCHPLAALLHDTEKMDPCDDPYLLPECLDGESDYADVYPDTMITQVEITDHDRLMFPDLENVSRLFTWNDDQGFVHSHTLDFPQHDEIPVYSNALCNDPADLDQYAYISDDSEIRHILGYYGLDHESITAMLVKTGNGDYSDVLFTKSSRPYDIATPFYRLTRPF